MIQDNFIANVKHHIQLSEEELQYVRTMLTPSFVRQHDLLEVSGKISPHFIHVGTGCLMTYHTDPELTDHVIQFATAGWWTGDIQSLFYSKPSNYSTRALADSEVLLFTKNDIDTLLERIPKFERYFRIIFQNSLVTHQCRIIQNFASSAEERYVSFMERYPSLEQYVPLKYVASYLGITPEFLSKIRRKMMEK